MTSKSSTSSSSSEKSSCSFPDHLERRCTTHLDIHGVRIYPSSLIFINPFEGKKYEERITIVNIGKRPVKVRILEPTSSMIKIKTIKLERFIASGMSVRRSVKYIVSMMTLLRTCSIPIYINNNKVRYIIQVAEKLEYLSVDPGMINFGTLDAGPNTSMRELSVKNMGTKPARFQVDLGCNDLRIVVNPMRGIVMENASATLQVDVSILEPGKFSTEFWIICDTPVIVKVFGEVVIGGIVPINTFSIRDFTFIRFPRTYYGIKSYKTLLLRNRSQSNTLFVVTPLKSENAQKEIENTNSMLDSFEIAPRSGRMPPNDVRSFLFTFCPPKRKSKVIDTSGPYVLMLDINKLSCKDVSSSCEVVHVPSRVRDLNTIESTSYFSYGSSINEENQFISEMEEMYEESDDPMVPPNSYYECKVRLLLFAEVESPSVSAQPDELVLKNLSLNQTVQRIIQITNNSQHLSIFYKYKKIAFVEVVPSSGSLKPQAKKELVVYITPKSYSIVSTYLEIELLSPHHPNIVKELEVIGMVKVALYIHEKVESAPRRPDGVTAATYEFRKPNIKPKAEVYKKLLKGNALLALPNDRAGSLRPWKSAQTYRTIYAGIPRVKNPADEYQLTVSKTNLKERNNKLYLDYIRQDAWKHRSVQADVGYETLISKEKCTEFHAKISKSELTLPNFIPLMPEELFKINVHPRTWVVDNVVSHSEFINTVTIHNNNDMALMLSLVPLNSAAIQFPFGSTQVISGHSNSAMHFMCFANRIGVENHTLYVLINGSHVFEIAFSVNVRVKSLKFSCYEMEFLSTDPQYKYLEISNEYNTPIEFVWEFTGNLKVEPLDGCIFPGKTLTCIISYEVGKCQSNNYEISMRVDGRKNQYLKVKIHSALDCITFKDAVQFGDIGVDMSEVRTVTMKSTTSEFIPFCVSQVNDDVCELKVSPMKGTLAPYSFQKFTFSLRSTNAGNINSLVSITVGNARTLWVQIIGCAVSPKVSFQPDVIHFQKIAASSYDVECVIIKNEDRVPFKFEFDSERIPELKFSEYSDGEFTKPGDTFIVDAFSERKFTFHLYPFYPLVTSYPFPILVCKRQLLSPNTKMHMRVLSHRVNIKTWKYEFKYFPHFDFKSVLEQKIKFSAKQPVTFCVRFDELNENFKFEHIEGGKITRYSYSLVCELNTDERVLFKAYFTPTHTGEHNIKLPVFIEDDLVEQVHNSLDFHGIYYAPEMLYSGNYIFMGGFALNFPIKKEVEVTFNYHNPDCDINITYEDSNLYVSTDTFQVTSIAEILNLSMEFQSSEVYTMDARIKISCTCGSSLKLQCLGAIENNICTNYYSVFYFRLMTDVKINYLISLLSCNSRPSIASATTMNTMLPPTVFDFISTFPYFPDDSNEYTEFMESVVSATEIWMFEQGFFFSEYFKIPNTICQYRLEPPDNLLMIPLKVLLENICGSVLSIELIGTPDQIAVEFILYQYYEDVLLLLKDCGANMPHVKPEFLLPYEEYLRYHSGSGDVLSSDKYYKLTKQCWLDLILQVFKSVVYIRLPITLQLCDGYSGRNTITMNPSNFIQNGLLLSVNEYVNSPNGKLLVKWLNSCLIKELQSIEKLFPDIASTEQETIRTKYISNFDTDLDDSLAFLAMTLQACPFSGRFLTTFYLKPNNIEERFHNACLLIRCWKMLNMNFTITPNNILEPNVIQMIMFLCYCFEFFLEIRAKSTENLSFSIPLTAESSDAIILKNLDDFPMKYTIMFFDNDDGAFSVVEDEIVVDPRKTFTLNVFYKAINVKIHKVTLLLSGELRGTRSVHSRTYNLIGEPLLDQPLRSLSLKSPLYTVQQFDLIFQAQYEEELEYEIWFAKTKPTTVTETVLTSNHYYLKNNMLWQMHLPSSVVSSDNTGKIKLSGTVCSIMQKVTTTWCFLRNKKVGDLMIKITVTPSNSNIIADLKIYLSLGFQNTTCTCKSMISIENKCPRMVIVKIPKMNNPMWSSVRKHFFKNIDIGETIFWDVHQDTSLGTYVLKAILNDNLLYISDDIKSIFRKYMKYSLTTNNDDVVAPDELEIANTFDAEGTVDLVVHLSSNIEGFILKLSSMEEDFIEVRDYNININYV